MPTFRFPTQQFRSLPTPSGDARVGLFYTQAATVPRDIWDWRDVNPREVNRRSSVYRQIVQTLTGEPGRFHERKRQARRLVIRLASSSPVRQKSCGCVTLSRSIRWNCLSVSTRRVRRLEYAVSHTAKTT